MVRGGRHSAMGCEARRRRERARAGVGGGGGERPAVGVSRRASIWCTAIPPPTDEGTCAKSIDSPFSALINYPSTHLLAAPTPRAKHTGSTLQSSPPQQAPVRDRRCRPCNSASKPHPLPPGPPSMPFPSPRCRDAKGEAERKMIESHPGNTTRGESIHRDRQGGARVRFWDPYKPPLD